MNLPNLQSIKTDHRLHNTFICFKNAKKSSLFSLYGAEIEASGSDRLELNSETLVGHDVCMTFDCTLTGFLKGYGREYSSMSAICSHAKCTQHSYCLL